MEPCRLLYPALMGIIAKCVSCTGLAVMQEMDDVRMREIPCTTDESVREKDRQLVKAWHRLGTHSMPIACQWGPVWVRGLGQGRLIIESTQRP